MRINLGPHSKYPSDEYWNQYTVKYHDALSPGCILKLAATLALGGIKVWLLLVCNGKAPESSLVGCQDSVLDLMQMLVILWIDLI